MPAVKALLMWWIQQPDTNKRVESLNKRTILTIVKLIPVVSAVLAYILILSSAQAGVLTTAAVLLAFFGFVFFFIGRKEAKEDTPLYALAMAAFAGAFGGDGEGDSYSYEAEEQQAGTNIGSFTSVDIEGNEVSEAIFADTGKVSLIHYKVHIRFRPVSIRDILKCLCSKCGSNAGKQRYNHADHQDKPDDFFH